MTETRYLIAAPTQDVITLEEAKAQLGVTGYEKDEIIQRLIRSAVEEVDPASHGWLGRALRPQTWEIRLDGFPYWTGNGYYIQGHRIELPYPPLISVDSFKYDDGDGVEQTLVENTGYRVRGIGSAHAASVIPIVNSYWPSSVRNDGESVRIRYTAGYDRAAGHSDPLPSGIKSALLLAVSDAWSSVGRDPHLTREDVDGAFGRQWSDMASTTIRNAIEERLRPYRVFE